MSSESLHETLHATAISVGGRAALILGASGAGKSTLALQLICYGAVLVADDRTTLHVNGTKLIASVPPALEGRIEARGVGLLELPQAGPAPVALVVDLDREEPDRLPRPHDYSVLGVTLPCLWHPDTGDFAAAVLLCLRHGIPRHP
ncbi:HPr kinase/phosphorylase [Sulfitobacter noctilucae]|uniref:HPr kinase/phosphorylase n=1 Tax=Sulfitobacter noctilucae TaxID=1342302 RepID=UPI0004690EC4|nr:HPr kinase/phosphatase C-terminal domain-containing protein [Sulfitobacter noctilucae]